MGIFNKLTGRTSAADQAAACEESRRKIEHEATLQRHSASLQALSCCVMIVDENNRIVAMNAATVQMLQCAQEDIRKQLPDFDVDTLVGNELDVLSDDPVQQRARLDGLGGTATRQLKLGTRIFELRVSPVVDALQRHLGTVIEWADVTAKLQHEQSEFERIALAKKVAAENARIRSALDRVTSNVMLADADNRIVYVNDALVHMLTAAEHDIRTAVPGFNARELAGKSLSVFQQDGAADLSQLMTVASVHHSQVCLGPRTFSVIANPVFSASGERLGTVMEWRDLSEELRFKAVIQRTIEAAVNGNLEMRIDAENQTGFLGSISGGINQVLASFESVMTEASLVMSGLARGNLTRKISREYRGSYERLKTDVNGTIDRLVDVVLEIRDSAAWVKAGASEIAIGNANLSQRTEQQAASLEETSSAMEQITTTVQQNAANALQANSLARGARETAENGGKVVGQAIAAMRAISESSARINDIIGVIDDIAFQTNLLALNAAVEAARAGDQGRGFAVVADEVRSLAGRSAKAAREIKELIKVSSARVHEGSSLVNKSGETLDEIVTAVKKVNDIVAEISTASDEQAAGLHEINRAVAGMDEMTQQNAALVEEAATASESLGEQSETLEKLIAFFDTGAPPRPMPTAETTMVGTAVRAARTPLAGRLAERSRILPKAPSGSRVFPIQKTATANAARILDDDENNWTEF